MKYILGKKLEMSQVFKESGQVTPVTLVKAGPCVVTQVKKEDKDGYCGVQVGFESAKKVNKAQKGHFKGLDGFKHVREFRYKKKEELPEDLKTGAKIDVSTFQPGDKIIVSGISKGKGFQGVVRRHGFHGSPASHGHKDQLRMPGSIGATGPAKVFKGKKMPGRMGGEQVTVHNLEVVEVDQANNVLAIKGAVPGPRNGLITIYGPGELVTSQDKEVKVVEEKPAATEQKSKEDAPSTKPESTDQQTPPENSEPKAKPQDDKQVNKKDKEAIKTDETK